MQSICMRREPYGLHGKPFFGINPSTAIPFFDFADFLNFFNANKYYVCRVMSSIKTAKKHLLVFIKIQVLILPKNQMRSICIRHKPYDLHGKPFFGINPSTAIPFFDFADFLSPINANAYAFAGLCRQLKQRKTLMVFNKLF